MKTCVVMRSYNDMPIISGALRMLQKQTHPFKLIVFDNESVDGTLEEVRKYADQVVNVPKGTYVPGKVLNHGMRVSEGEFTVFLNSDCEPQNEHWLSKLIAGFSDQKVAAVFGRQIPRPDCLPLFAKDTEDTYGDGAKQKYWKHCFSAASSAIRRSVWEEMQFNEDIQYSEDIEWTWRARKKGYLINYVKDSIVAHSHNYNLSQFYKRHYGEGKAEAVIFDWSSWDRSFIRYSILPYVRQILADWKYCLPKLLLKDIIYSPFLRLSQLFGRRKGFKEGLK